MINMNTDDYKDVQMAALLHDIGKFLQRADREYHLTAHEKLGASFIRDIGLNVQIENMVLYHMGSLSPLNGKDKFLADIIQKSDRYSSKEREKIEGTADTMTEPLISVFSKLKLNEKNDTKEHYYPVTKLELKKFPFPIRTKKEAMKGGWNLQPSYEKIWKDFSEDIKKIQNCISFDTIYHLLRKYTSFIPSAAWKSYPDISLFDHSKTTAAISSCLYQYGLEKGVYSINDKIDYFIIISGDISGIQNFIYNISSPQFAQKDTTKRLRGRSFYINLLNENLARILIEKMELNTANILWCGGGHFLIIAPNTNKADKILKEYEKEINEYLFRKYGGGLFLSLVWRPVSGKDLDNFAILKADILFDNSRKKRQKYLSNLDMVFREEESIPADICKICGAISNEDVCNECSIHKDLGDKITRAQYIMRVILKDSAENKFDLQEFNTGYLLLKKKEDLLEEIERIYKSASQIQIFTLNSTDFLDGEIIKKLEKKNIQVSFGFSFIGNTVPFIDKVSDEFHLLSFEEIAKVSRGSKKLGILKMDIDNLGKLFEIGLGDDVSISRTSTMSSLLDIFISGYINDLANEYYVLSDICPECIKKVDCIDLTYNIKIYREKENEGKIERVCDKCAKKKIPIIYINYAGGDDLLVVGPWDIIVRFAKDLRDKFKKYTCMNQDINVSAGIHICGPKFPMARSVIISNDMLNRSKILGKYSDKELGKDRISIFNETVKWDTFDQFKGYEELLQFADQLDLLIEKNKISHNFVYDLLILLKSTFKDLEELEYNIKIRARLEQKKYVPVLKYKLARLIKEKNDKEDLNKRLITERMFPWIEIPASIVSLKWR